MSTVTFYPSGAGDETNITSQTPASGAHWDKMNVAGRSVSTTSTSFQTDLYAMGMSIGGGKINSVTVGGVFGQAATSKVANVIKMAGTKYEGTETDVGDIGITVETVYTLSPATGSRWSWSEIYSLQAGAKIKAFGGGYIMYLTNVYITVDFTIETSKPNVDFFFGS